MIVDTIFVLDVIDGVEEAIEKERELEAAGVPLVIPAMTLLELYIGVGKVTNSARERQQVEAIFDIYPLVEMSPSISRRAGRLLGEQMNTGDGDGPGIGKGDAAIAATALERDEPILTADSHFETIDGVEVETYR
ncbi:PIN domain-containing protein (plasmid) [Halorussus limi]|uniref:Ribonuclease VapC n=1 Tax=Halorussus limi TaxID=2938695 RepID=A0A8U0I2V4_9EURY|nr:PIN domain-containing protein [Halorussus limi]UPV77236.1 PIN domain-containing protein [Halorussus limi]